MEDLTVEHQQIKRSKDNHRFSVFDRFQSCSCSLQHRSPFVASLSASDAMENEADRMARFECPACTASRTLNTGGASFISGLEIAHCFWLQ
jgi:hypothetical protein